MIDYRSLFDLPEIDWSQSARCNDQVQPREVRKYATTPMAPPPGDPPPKPMHEGQRIFKAFDVKPMHQTKTKPPAAGRTWHPSKPIHQTKPKPPAAGRTGRPPMNIPVCVSGVAHEWRTRGIKKGVRRVECIACHINRSAEAAGVFIAPRPKLPVAVPLGTPKRVCISGNPHEWMHKGKSNSGNRMIVCKRCKLNMRGTDVPADNPL